MPHNATVPTRVSPTRLRIEASSVCQLRCSSCPTASRAAQATIGSGFLQPRDFEKLLDENPRVRRIEISNYGEIFLNPQLPEILRLAHSRGVHLTAVNGANLNKATDEALEALVAYELRELCCSIDGASPDSYSKYRVKGAFESVVANIKRINRFKAKRASPFPKLIWQLIAFGHNEHEIDRARRMATQLNMEFRLKLSWDEKTSPVQHQQRLRTALGVATRTEYRDRYGQDYAWRTCYQLWNEPQINWDGKLLGCSRNFWGDFASNTFDVGLVEAINNDRMTHARRMLQGTAEPRDEIPCSSCQIYLDIRRNGNWLRPRRLHRLVRELLDRRRVSGELTR